MMDAAATSRLRRQVLLRFASAFIFMMAMLFLPAGTLTYWQAWIYLVVMFLPATFAFVWLLKDKPELAERRIQWRERDVTQGRIVSLAGVAMLATFVVPGFDFRWGWSDVPLVVVIVGDAIVLASYLLVIWVLQVNEFASRVVRVEQSQRVVDTGPYAIIRHPMYLGVMGMILATPLALGSLWALIPAVVIIPVLMARIREEEAVLVRDLPGYADYVRRVRHRLIPGIW